LLVEPGVEVPCESAIALLTSTADEPLISPSGGATPVVSTLQGQSDHQPITTADESAAQPADPRMRVSGEVPATRPQSEAPPQSEAAARAHVNASPAAKNLAKQLGIDLATVTGTGPGGRIGLEDVQRAADALASTSSIAGAPQDNGREAYRSQVQPTAVEDVPPIRSQSEASPRPQPLPLSKMRAAIARRMTAATAVPQFTVRRRVDMTAALHVRQAQRAAADGHAPGVIDLIHLAVTRALLAHPEVNASFHDGQSPEQSAIVMHPGVDLGLALALPDGLIVPVVRSAHTMSLQELAAERVRLQEEARAGRLASAALGGATFTVSNLGTLHVDEFTAIVTPPEVAILAVGQLQDTPVVRDGVIHIVPLIALTVTADHRGLDGAQVARFLDTLATNLDHLEALS
jgi:pyruvate dehydrogenase E2 component (dihydrolipoamide acetyltransferase)